ncbi:Alpha-methylacyl-CoA racemase [Psychrobacter nivimaris]|uniref:Alpha-methylacyl-CoA racemase n=1 Tax=Psychrobacter nivimaris TaxID=281738 RepID=A0A6N7BYZ6_9GAMM|nr:CaiB/BaiF CoA-transferase family protein [Psychrobacter nivimaris]KAF0569618.1 Alpha-methylacyl-CoA racemase [Psychrobacter nivimaris]|tara:strand:- start:118 stop:1257 length:1140 start_codon:yes stop_codon:yes gene_type:complete
MTDRYVSNPDQMKDCLQGLRVIDLTRNLPGPFATRLLADLGADVLKIEPKQGDPARVFGELFAALNHGKTTEKYDFHDAKAIGAIKAHLKEADVMLDSFRPGILAEMGLDAKTLHTINPKLVMVSITGYGLAGNYAKEGIYLEDADSKNSSQVNHDWSNKAGHDINFMAMSGVLDQLKTAQGEQAMPNIQFADLAGGSDTAVIALLAAVFAAQRTGRGRHIAISMTHSLYNHMVMPKVTGKLINSLSGDGLNDTLLPQHDFLGGALPCYRLYQTADQRYMAVGSLELKFWQGLCEVLELPSLKETHWQLGIMPNRPESEAATNTIAEKFASQTLKHWQRVFAATDVCVTPVLSLHEAKAHLLFAHQDEHHATSGWQQVN